MPNRNAQIKLIVLHELVESGVLAENIYPPKGAGVRLACLLDRLIESGFDLLNPVAGFWISSKYRDRVNVEVAASFFYAEPTDLGSLMEGLRFTERCAK